MLVHQRVIAFFHREMKAPCIAFAVAHGTESTGICRAKAAGAECAAEAAVRNGWLSEKIMFWRF